MPLGGQKEKYSHSKCRQPESNLVPGGSGNPAMKVDMEILRGLENLGAPWDSMGRFPVINLLPRIIRTLVQA